MSHAHAPGRRTFLGDRRSPRPRTFLPAMARRHGRAKVEVTGGTITAMGDHGHGHGVDHGRGDHGHHHGDFHGRGKGSTR